MNVTNERTVGECVDLLFYENVWNNSCLQLLASKIVGYTIVVTTAILMKLPQIIKMLKARSAEGLSATGEFLKLVTNSVACSYCIAKAFPISTWGESIFLAVQSLIICVLILIYKQKLRSAVAMVAVYVVVMVILLSPITSDPVRAYLQMTTIPFIITSRVLQIWANYKNSSTGVLSATSVFTLQLRSMGRLFTSIRETGDTIKITIYSTAMIFNFMLSGQVIYYNLGKTKYSTKEKES